MIQVTFLPAGKTVSVAENSPLIAAAALAGIPVETPCGGKGVCGKCLVRVQLGSVDAGDSWLIGDTLASQGYVMICTAKLRDEDVSVFVPFNLEGEAGKFADNLSDYARVDAELLPSGPPEFIVTPTKLSVTAPKMGDGLSDLDRLMNAEKVSLPLNALRKLPDALRAKDGEITLYRHGERIVDVGVEEGEKYAVAIDLGTTTVAASICGGDGAPIFVATTYNGQIGCGLDIISRINYAGKPERLSELRDKALASINRLIAELAEKVSAEPHDIYNLSLSGNTTMIHLLLGIPPENIRLEPYIPAVYKVPMYTAGQIGLSILEDAPVDIAPSVGSYLGGDITSGALLTTLAIASDALCLFIDIGTNGEILLGNSDFLLGCACSAGPAFEGGGISCGMRASTGAIERVSIDPEHDGLTLATIGGGEAIGICGSGMISLIAELFRSGLLDAGSKLVRGASKRIVENGKSASFKLTDTISITEGDIDNVVRAKAAIFSACQTMLKSVEMGFSDIDRVYIAGGFGRYLDIRDASAIGLLPPLPREKFTFIGNASLMGTHMALISKKHREIRENIANAVTYLDLSVETGYMDEYMAALFLPHTDREMFEGLL